MHVHLVRIRHVRATNTKGRRVNLTLVSGNKNPVTLSYDYGAQSHGIADYELLAFVGLKSGIVDGFVQDRDGDMFAVVMGK